MKMSFWVQVCIQTALSFAEVAVSHTGLSEEKKAAASQWIAATEQFLTVWSTN